MEKSRNIVSIEGSTIRQRLRIAGLPGGAEKLCCGGKISFSKDYESQLKRLGMRGNFKILERGVVVAQVTVL